MAFHVKDDFKAGGPITQVPASWFNRVGSFLNNLVGGYGVTVEKNERGASTVSLDASKLPKATAAPSEPASTVDLTTADEGKEKAASNAWGYDGSAGVKVTLQTRTCYLHTNVSPVLYGFFRTFTFDAKGMLLSVSGETRYEIDRPVVGNIAT